MRRQIIRQGNNSFTITLPAKWVKEEGIKGDSEIEIEQEGKDLLVRLPKDAKNSDLTAKVNLRDFNERTIKNILNYLYRKGFDKITARFNEPKQLLMVKDITRTTLLGFEVVEENGKSCTVANIAEPSSDKYEVILRKIFLSLKEDSALVLNDFRAGKATNIKELEKSKSLIDNYTNFCRRLIIKYRIGGSKDSYLNLLVVSRLSLIYHAYYYMYLYASSKKSFRPEEESLNLLDRANKMFDLFYESFYNKDIKKADVVFGLKEKLIQGTLYELLEKSKEHDGVILYHIGEIIRLIHLASINISGLADLEN